MKICSDCLRCYDDTVEACAERGHRELQPIRPGQTHVAGRYRIERWMGGVLFAARQMELDRPVAIRLIPSGWLPDGGAREAFLRQARALASVSHPNLVAVYDSGVLPDGEGYVAMELVDGETLHELLEASGPLPVPAAAEIGRQVAQGLAAAHRAGSIHGGLKSSDVIVSRELGGRGVVRVVGFTLGAGPPDGAARPSVAWRDPTADARSDVLALGVILYEMLAGHLPHEPAGATASRSAAAAPAPLQSLRRDVPDGLAWLVMQCLLRSPAGRPKTAAEVAERLLPFESGAALPPPRPPIPRRRPSFGIPAPLPLETRPPVAAAAPESRSPAPPAVPAALPPPPLRPETPDPVAKPPEAPAAPGGTSVPPEAASPAAESAPEDSSEHEAESAPHAAVVYGAVLAAVALAAGIYWVIVERAGPSAAGRPAANAPPRAATAGESAGPPAASRSAMRAADPPLLPSVRPAPAPVVSVASRSRPQARFDAGSARLELRQALSQWIAATNGDDTGGYMRFYMPQVDPFYLARNVSRSFVRAEKNRVLHRARRVRVTAGEPEIAFDEHGRTAVMRFPKRYVIEGPRNTRRGTVLQELRWVRTDGGWKIVGERDAKVLR
jgi:hypothetical protein